jgi:hypothetical protein
MNKQGNPAPRTAGKSARARRNRPPERNTSISAKDRQRATAETPIYAIDRRELRVGTIIVKCFTQRSDAQEIILASFQEENWCPNIDDPLPVKHNQDPQQRLRRAVDNLNRRQRTRLLHFQVIRQGTGVAWRFLENSDARAT